jgi:PAS domain S-box-containing protein
MSKAPTSLALDDLPVAMALLDASQVVRETNRAFRALLPPRTQAVGAPLKAVLDAAGATLEGGDFGKVFRLGGRDFRMVLRRRGRGALAMLTDVTAARAAYEDVRVEGDVREQLMRDAEIGVWRYDPDLDTYYFPAELSLGHGDAGRPLPRAMLQQLQHPDDRAKDDAMRERLTREGGQAELEMRYLAADGSWTHLHVHARAGRRTASGLYEIHGVSLSITPLARARDAANANAQRLGLALGASRSGVFERELRTGSYWFSPELRELLGLDAAEAAMSDPLSVFHPDDRAALERLGEPQPGGGAPEPADARLAHGGRELWVRVFFEIERDAKGRAHRGVGLVMDIDEAKRQEIALLQARRAAEEATAAKSDFLASVSHEIRTPMNGVVGVLNLLKRERLSADGALLLDEALGCAEMLGQLVNDVLDFSKIEAGKLTLEPAPADPAAIVDGVVRLLRPQAQAKGLALTAEAADGLGWAELDALRVRQCLFNVIGNAVKFTEAGSVTVRVAARGAGGKRRLRFEVEDTGIGVPPDARARLFGRFEQAEAGPTRRFGGTGLGLAISRQLARMMGGDLDYESREGVGSTFWFEVAAPAAAAADPQSGAAPEGAPLQGLRVLVVDDNRVNRLVGVRSVEALGAEAEAVDGGAQAIAAVRDGGFDLVLMDVNMPEMDGLEASRRIRALPGPPGQTPILALTADVMRRKQQAYLAAGMDGMAPKPFSPAQLLAEIARLAGDGETASKAG